MPWRTVALMGALLLTAACRSTPQRPPRPGPDPVAERLAARLSDPKLLQPYLDAYPLGDAPLRADRIGSDPSRSLHLIQLRADLPRHAHPHAVETAYVLVGTGTVRIEGRTYRAEPGATFRIEAGLAHSVHADPGRPLVAVVYFDPPQGDEIERELR